MCGWLILGRSGTLTDVAVRVMVCAIVDVSAWAHSSDDLEAVLYVESTLFIML